MSQLGVNRALTELNKDVLDEPTGEDQPSNAEDDRR
jgi:hypothetical protein